MCFCLVPTNTKFNKIRSSQQAEMQTVSKRFGGCFKKYIFSHNIHNTIYISPIFVIQI